MRMIALVLIICGTLPSWCQQAPTPRPDVAGLLAKLHSKDWTERSNAVDDVRTDPDMLHSQAIRAALLNLLDWENRKADKVFREARTHNHQEADNQDSEDAGTEGYGEYCAWLAQTVESFANWNDPRQACILVNAAQITYPSSSADAAARARAAMPCLLQMSVSDLKINRAIAIPMLAEALEKAKGTLDERSTQTAKKIMLSDLRDSDVGLRASAVHALRQFGTPDMIPALEEVSAKDPAPEEDGHSIRKSAAEAIAEIQKRAGRN